MKVNKTLSNLRLSRRNWKFVPITTVLDYLFLQAVVSVAYIVIK